MRIVVFHVVFWAIQIGIFVYGYLKQKYDPELELLNRIGQSVFISRGAGLVLGVDCAALLLPVCRNILRSLRSSSLNKYIPFDDALYLHKWLAYSTLLFSLIHVNAHYTNFFTVETKLPGLGLKAWMIHYLAWGGATGHIMLIIMFFMYTAARSNVKQKNYETFWYSHHLFVPFYFCLFFHSFGCFVKSASTGQCKGYNSNYGTVPVFCMYIAERLLREYRARLPTSLNKVIFHPGNTMELRIEKPSFQYMPGQYLFLNIPAISYFQWHPFTISSSPEEGFVSVHIRIVGDWTKKVAQLMEACESGAMNTLPRLLIDGPYGAPAEDLYKYKVAILVGAGIGVTPAASLLKSIWYKYYRRAKMPLEKVYFFWINRNKDDFAWFQSLVASLEDTVPESFLEIHTYLTGNMSADDIHNIAINDAEFTDPVTDLQTRTHFGRPQWSRILQTVRSNLPKSAVAGQKTDVGIFFCGPPPLAKVVGKCAKACSDSNVYFEMRKEHF